MIVPGENGCWLWVGPVNPKGYGRVSNKGHRRYAHRVAWELVNGPIPKGMCVCHRCDIRNCVNPDHLFLGTQADNMHDCHQKGRINGKLVAAQVREIRMLAAAGRTKSDLARQYGVTPTQIHNIVRRHDWRHL